MKRVREILKFVDNAGIYPDMPVIEGPAEPLVTIEGREYLMFSSNNYLGLSNHPRVVQAAIEAITKYGVGSDGSRLLSGNLKVHRDFELAIARFKGGEDAIVWPSGYAANLGTISALMKPIKLGPGDYFKFTKDVILSDELNHASIIDGAALSGQKKVVYKHCDMTDLESKLRRYKGRRKLVVTDSVFSMDGDIAPLDKIVPLCKKYGAMLMIDEAHASGVLGRSGHGSLEHFGLRAGHDVDIVLGTCSKALAATGGFVVANAEVVRYLRVASRSYMFSTAMLPASSAALIEILRVIDDEPERRVNLLKNSEYLRTELKKAGFDTYTSRTQIIPLMVGDEHKAIALSRALFVDGFYCPNVRWPAVPKGQARLRFTVMASHTTTQIDNLVQACVRNAKNLGVL